MLFRSNYAILDKDNRPIGYARSVWAMINLSTRKPANLIELHGGDISEYIVEKDCPIEKPSRIKVTSQEPVAKMLAKYTDIDINGHVNSIRYIEHILDLFPLEKYKKGIRRFEMAYVAESYYNDELSFYVDELTPSEYAIEIKRNGDQIVCRSKMVFNS